MAGSFDVAFKLRASTQDKLGPLIVPGNLDEVLFHRLVDHTGKFRIGRLNSKGQVVEPGPWRTAGEGADAFAARVRGEARVNRVWRIESAHENWKLNIRGVAWPIGSQVITAAKSMLGVRYVWGTAIPGVSFDCSGLTMWAWSTQGVMLPHNAAMQWDAVPHVTDPIQGDLVFFDYYGTGIDHVGLWYAKGGTYGVGTLIDTRSPNGQPVEIRSIEPRPQLVGFGRPKS